MSENIIFSLEGEISYDIQENDFSKLGYLIESKIGVPYNTIRRSYKSKSNIILDEFTLVINEMKNDTYK
jgi:hypothetical protein